MMFNPPFFGSPFYRRMPPPYYNPPSPEFPRSVANASEQANTEQEAARSSVDSETSDEKRANSDYDSQVLNIFGITLHFDDLLIIGLLFFLYSEGVQDEMLFVALILLLLS